VRSVVIFNLGEVMDEKLVELFMKWLKAFEALQSVTEEQEIEAAGRALSEIEAQSPRLGCAGSL
jgi:hypothetical protein